MYVAQSDACSVPTSATPVTDGQIAAKAQRLMDTNTIVQKALQQYTALLNRPDLNQNGFPLKTHGGTPSSPFQGFTAWPDWTQGSPESKGCLNTYQQPVSVPTDTRDAVAAPLAPPMVPQTIEGRAVTSTGKPPTTGNVCQDLQKGYAIQSQVSTAMLFKCSKAGYSRMGLKPTHPAVTALQLSGKLAPIPDQDVPDYDPQTMGLAGVDGVSVGGLFKLLAWGVGGYFLMNAVKGAMSR